MKKYLLLFCCVTFTAFAQDITGKWETDCYDVSSYGHKHKSVIIHMLWQETGDYEALYDLFEDQACLVPTGKNEYKGKWEELVARTSYNFKEEGQEYSISTDGYRFISFDGNKDDLIFLKYFDDKTIRFYAPIISPATKLPEMLELSQYHQLKN